MNKEECKVNTVIDNFIHQFNDSIHELDMNNIRLAETLSTFTSDEIDLNPKIELGKVEYKMDYMFYALEKLKMLVDTNRKLITKIEELL